MALASVAIKSARTYLNDINGITWSDSILIPLLQEAHGELTLEIEKFFLPVVMYQTGVILVPAGSLTLGASQPSNITVPLSMSERSPGSDLEDFEPMQRVNFIPTEDQDSELTWWSWNQETISFLGATQDVEVLLRYKGTIVTPQKLTDPLGFIFAERFLGPRVAGLALDSVGKDGNKFNTLADSNLYKIVQSNVTSDQRPTRRRAYRSSKGLQFGSGSIGFPR